MLKSREQLKQEYIDSLDSFISENPTIGQLDTAKFRDFLIGLVEHESGFNPTAKQGSYFGWYQTNKLDADPYAQHMNAFNHLNSLFKNTITKEDIQKARSLGINDSALMLKYWNQGNRVNNYLWNNKDSADGLGTLISKYGNDLTMPLDVYGYAMDNLYGDYTVKKGDNWFDIQKRVRIPGRNYATGGKDLWAMQKLSGIPFGSLKIGQSFKFGDYVNTNTEEQTVKNSLLEKLINQSDLLENNKVINTSANKQTILPRSKSGTLWIPNSNPPKEQEIRDIVYNSFKYQNGGNLVYREFKSETEKDKNETNDSDLLSDLIFTKAETFPTFPVSDWDLSNFARDWHYTVPTKKGTVQYSNGVNVGNMQELIDLMIDEGISFRITSGNRPGALTSNGEPSYHGSGNALDITPISGQSWDDLINQMRRSKRFVYYMREHKLGILDERSKEMQAKTGATGPHFHIGPDSRAVSNFDRMFG